MPLSPREPWPAPRRPGRPPRTPRDQPGRLRTAQHVSWSQPAGLWPPTARVHARRRAPPPVQVKRRRRCRVAMGMALRGGRLHEREFLLHSSLPAAGHVHHRRSHRDRLHGGVVPMPRCLATTVHCSLERVEVNEAGEKLQRWQIACCRRASGRCSHEMAASGVVTIEASSRYA